MNNLYTFLFVLLSLPMVHAQGIRAVVDTTSEAISIPAMTDLITTYQGRQISVATGGGFTGFTTTYYLLANGSLYRRYSRDSTFTFIGQQTEAQTKKLFKALENTCKIKKTDFDHPGNRFTVVRWRKGDENYKVGWGMPGHTVPKAYPKFVTSFMAIVPTSNGL